MTGTGPEVVENSPSNTIAVTDECVVVVDGQRPVNQRPMLWTQFHTAVSSQQKRGMQ